MCAGGKEIPNYGERTLTLSTLDWSSVRNMTFQVTDVTKALGSVSKMVAHGNRVVFDGSGSFIENKRSRERLWMREESGVDVLDVYVAPPDCHEKNKDFSQAGNSLASSPVRPFNKKARKGVSDGRSSLGVLSEARPVEDDQTESETDNWKDFSKRAHLTPPALQTPQKIPREDPQRKTKRAKMGREREKKAQNVGPPTLRGLTFWPHHPSGPHRL